MRFSFRRAVNNTFIFSVDNELELEFRWIKGEEHTSVVEHGKKKKSNEKYTPLYFICVYSILLYSPYLFIPGAHYIFCLGVAFHLITNCN